MFSKQVPELKLVIRIILVAVIVGSFIFSVLNYFRSNRYPEPEVYYGKMIAASENPCQMKLADIFDFEFDWAYIAGNEVYAEEEYFLKKLDVRTDVDIVELFSGHKNRVLFVKDDTVIYDYVYELYTTDFDFVEQEGVVVYPETVLSLSQQKDEQSGETILYFRLIDLGSSGEE